MDMIIAGVSAPVVVSLLVEAIKRIFKIEGDAAIPLAVAVGLGVALLGKVMTLWPEVGLWGETALVGVLMGLAACGLYDIGQGVKAQFVK